MDQRPTDRFTKPSAVAESPDEAPPIGAKAYAVILGTLVLGMLLGALMTGFAARQAGDGVTGLMQDHESVEAALVALIEPTEAQREAIAPILVMAGNGMISNMVLMRHRIHTHVDSVLVQLDVHLTDAQMERVVYALRVRPNETFANRIPAPLRARIEAAEAQGDVPVSIPAVPSR
ncbi:MAG: hypothetical protein AAGF99_06550 [Bacteroidota bacterium]